MTCTLNPPRADSVKIFVRSKPGEQFRLIRDGFMSVEAGLYKVVCIMPGLSAFFSSQPVEGCQKWVVHLFTLLASSNTYLLYTLLYSYTKNCPAEQSGALLCNICTYRWCIVRVVQ